MNRCFQALLIVSTAGLSWLLMMFFHECGHAWHGWLSGARLARVHLPLVGFSQTDFVSNPHPLFVAWGGPMWGCLAPLAILAGCRLASKAIARRRGNTTTDSSLTARHYTYLAAWFAGFCLIANGAYLLGGIFFVGGADDGGAILHNGGARWQLAAFGVLATAAGLYCWNGLGPYFGFGASRGRVDRKAALGTAVALACVIALLAIR